MFIWVSRGWREATDLPDLTVLKAWPTLEMVQLPEQLHWNERN
jgi:hypothetical protein